MSRKSKYDRLVEFIREYAKEKESEETYSHIEENTKESVLDAIHHILFFIEETDREQ